MRVAHLAYYYGENGTGGAAIASTRLHRALLAAGVDSHYICVHQREPGLHVHQLPHGFARRIYQLLTGCLRHFWRLTSYRMVINTNIIPLFGLSRKLKEIAPDVLHVQWLNADVCAYEQLSRMPCRFVFNLHDCNVITASQSYPGKDRRFVDGYTDNNSSRLERFMFRRKLKMIRRCRPVFVGPSEWVCDECRASIIGRDFRAFAVPNIVSGELGGAGCGVEKSKKFRLLFGAVDGRKNQLKGFSDLAKAFKCLSLEIKKECVLEIFGESAADCETEGIETHFLGTISQPDELARIYADNDLFLFPSRQETQGMTKVEAMLNGLPVVAFDRTACAEGIEHRETGWIAPDGDSESFAKGIVHYYDLWKRGDWSDLRRNVSERTRQQFSPEAIVARILAVYRSAMMPIDNR